VPSVARAPPAVRTLHSARVLPGPRDRSAAGIHLCAGVFAPCRARPQGGKGMCTEPEPTGSITLAERERHPVGGGSACRPGRPLGPLSSAVPPRSPSCWLRIVRTPPALEQRGTAPSRTIVASASESRHRPSPGEYDLAEAPVAFHVAVSFYDFGKGKGAVDHRMDAAGPEEGEDGA
jgi:hypothetical protein